MARITSTLPGSTYTEKFSAKRIVSQVGTGTTARLAMDFATQRAAARVAALAPRDTGELQLSVEGRAVMSGANPRVEIKTVVHGGYVEHGTINADPQPFIAPVMKSDRDHWEADVRKTKAALDKQVAEAEKKAKGRERDR